MELKILYIFDLGMFKSEFSKFVFCFYSVVTFNINIYIKRERENIYVYIYNHIIHLKLTQYHM